MSRILSCRPQGALLLLLFGLLLSLTALSNALHFYLDSTTPICFFEELPKDTLVVGHYTAEQFDKNVNTYTTNPDLKLLITVTEVFDNDHALVTQRGGPKGKFTFTAADSGDHRICFAPSHANLGGAIQHGEHLGNVKLIIDIAIGETSKIESTDKGKIDDIVQKVKDLNSRLQDVRREQVFQREREAEFRDQSESTNSRVVRWTIIQLVILAVTCAWQLSHLRAFFIKQKLT